MIDAKAVKDATRIEDIVNEDQPLTFKSEKHGRWEGQNHHSLTVYAHDGFYVWFSRAERGDVFDWLRLHRGMDFRDALAYLARRANMDLDWTPDQEEQYQRKRTAEDTFTAAMGFWAGRLASNKQAMAYCQGRGWDEKVARKAGLGFNDGDKGALERVLQADGVDTSSPAAQAVLRCPAGMLIYPHVERGRIVYWSARSIEGKQHYNPPRDLVGERKPFYNHVFTTACTQVVVVEGQADAVTLGAWEIAAVALAGCTINEELAAELSRYPQVLLGMDADEAGLARTHENADALGPLARLVRWPAKDANEWSLDGGSKEAAIALLRDAPSWISLVARTVQSADDRDGALRHMIELAVTLTDFQLSARRDELARAAGIGLRQFDGLLKTVKAEKGEMDGKPDRILVEKFVPGGVVATEQGDVVFEMIIESSTQSSFVVRWPGGKIETVRALEMNGVAYYPYDPMMPLIEKGVVLLPSETREYGTTADLVQEVKAFIHTFLDVSPLYERIATYYVLLTWLYDAFTVLPYLRALGDYGTGKSRFLDAIGYLCYRSLKTSGASTFSPVFRVIEMFHGTLLLDEMDMTMSDTEADFIKLLNSGVARGTPLLRTEKAGDAWVVEAYDTFCPKIVATRKRFSDRALESRMLTYEMGVSCRDDIPQVLPAVFYECAQEIRNKLLLYRLNNWQRMEVDWALVDRTVEPRLSQVTLALKTIVNDPTLQAEIDEFIREYHRQTVVERGMTLSAVILEVVIDLHNEPTGVQLDGTTSYDLSMKTIAKRVNEVLDDENFPDEEQQGGRNRPKLTPRKVGEEVRKLGLGTQRKPDKSRAYEVIWNDERIESLKVRYGLK